MDVLSLYPIDTRGTSAFGGLDFLFRFGAMSDHYCRTDCVCELLFSGWLMDVVRRSMKGHALLVLVR